MSKNAIGHTKVTKKKEKRRIKRPKIGLYKRTLTINPIAEAPVKIRNFLSNLSIFSFTDKNIKVIPNKNKIIQDIIIK